MVRGRVCAQGRVALSGPEVTTVDRLVGGGELSGMQQGPEPAETDSGPGASAWDQAGRTTAVTGMELIATFLTFWPVRGAWITYPLPA